MWCLGMTRDLGKFVSTCDNSMVMLFFGKEGKVAHNRVPSVIHAPAGGVVQDVALHDAQKMAG